MGKHFSISESLVVMVMRLLLLANNY